MHIILYVYDIETMHEGIEEDVCVELKKEQIWMREQSCWSNLQITLEDDFNVPDSKPDVERMITEDGRIEIVETNLLNGKVIVKGVLHFEMLYISHEGQHKVHNIQGKIPFDEMINLDNVKETDSIRVKWQLEDVKSSLINSRKISVKALVMLVCEAWHQKEEDVPVGIEEGEKYPCKYEEMQVTELVVAKKDLLRVKESIHLPVGKPNIDQILYSQINTQNLEIRAQDGQILLRGEMQVFVLYRGLEEEERLVYYVGEHPFYSTLECNESAENRMVQMDMELQSKEIQVKADEDGEDRILELELALSLDFSILEDRSFQYLRDAYSLENELCLERKDTKYRHLLLKNASQKRGLEQIVIEPPANPVLQICNSKGLLQIDEKRWEGKEISVEGSIEVKVLYLGEQDQWPLGELSFSVPFVHNIEGVGEQEEKIYEIEPKLEQLSVMLVGKDAVEVKYQLNMDTTIYEQPSYSMIREVTERQWEDSKFEQLPDMVGYLVQPEDDLWSVAKRFCTTEEAIVACNQLKEKKLTPGEKILVFLQDKFA